MKKLVSGLIVSLGLVVAANASDLKAGDMVVKDYDKYRLNTITYVCEKTKQEFRNRLMTDLSTGLVRILNVYTTDGLGHMTHLVAEDAKASVQIFLFDNYGECEFNKAVMIHRAGAEDAPKYVGLKDPNAR